MRVKVENMICTTDFSDAANQAVPFGIALAREFKARLYLCHVIDISAVATYGEGFSDPLEQEKRLRDYAEERLGKLMSDAIIDWQPVIRIGHVADQIVWLAQEKKADLVISATHGRSGLKRLVLGSVTERLMRTLPCPLFVVRSLQQDEAGVVKEGIRLERILVGCDFSADSDLALQYGFSLAQEFQSEVHLVHVIEPTVYKDLLRPAVEEKEAYHQDLRKELWEKLNRIVPEEVCNWCTPKTALLAGHPHVELTKYAVLHDIDLVVLGVRGQNVVETLFVGSTTDRVIREAPCPVLSVADTRKAGGIQSS